MAALIFPPAPATGARFPLDPGTSGVTQWEYDGAKWVVVPSFVSLGSPNQTAYNDYQWPAADGTLGQQLQTDGAGNLSWAISATNNLQAIGMTPVPDGIVTTFTLVELNTNIAFSPSPSNNIVVFLGGVPQTPNIALGGAYDVAGNQITFASAPPAGTTFYGISSVVI